MAKADFKLRIGRFFTDTRILTCVNTECRFHQYNSSDVDSACGLKKIRIGRDGKCVEMESRKE